MKTTSRSGEMQFFGNGDEVFQITEFHRIIIAKSCYAEDLIYWRPCYPSTIMSADESTTRKPQHRQTKLYAECSLGKRCGRHLGANHPGHGRDEVNVGDALRAIRRMQVVRGNRRNGV